MDPKYIKFVKCDASSAIDEFIWDAILLAFV